MRTEGTTEANSIIALTEVTPTSTKTPIIFPGEFLFAGTIGEVGDPEKYVKELKSLKNFQNESIMGPKYSNILDNFNWISQIDPENKLMTLKKSFLKEKGKKDMPAIGFLMEEKTYNPFLRLDDPYYTGLMGTENEALILQKLKAYEQQHKSPSTTS